MLVFKMCSVFVANPPSLNRLDPLGKTEHHFGAGV